MAMAVRKRAIMIVAGIVAVLVVAALAGLYFVQHNLKQKPSQTLRIPKSLTY